MDEDGSYWNHRTIRHVHSKYPSHEVYLTVHEVFYQDNKPFLWSPNERSPQSKEDCELMAGAFDKDPVIEVDDATIEAIHDGFGTDYKVWKWLVPNSDTGKQD